MPLGTNALLDWITRAEETARELQRRLEEGQP